MSPTTLTRRRIRALVRPRPTVLPSWFSPGRTGRIGRMLREDRGMSTVEYAIGCVAAAAFAAVLYTVISGDSVVTALTQIVQRALTAGF